jgi:hypothetical protein
MLGLFLGCAGLKPPEETPPNLMLTVVNKTGRPLVELYGLPAWSALSTDDLLNGSPVRPGERRRIFFEPPFRPAYWDLLALDDQGTEYRVSTLRAGHLSAVISASQSTDDGDIDLPEDIWEEDVDFFTDDDE